jgi:2'-hydroxyisoflavone reductase
LAWLDLPRTLETDLVNLLILGGTAFLGPQLVEAALARGHTITLFNRGKTNPHLFPDLEKLRGNRDPLKDEGLKALEGRSWDVVIDTSGYVPRIVRASAELLAPSIRQYIFISSISVYPDSTPAGADESAPVGTIADETVEEMGASFENYGPLKALCEQAAEQAMPGRTTNIRPGLIVGPGDGSERFTYWPVRIDRGGEVLAPLPQEAPVQFIDVRDLALWTIRMAEDGHAGVFNATGPRSRLSFAEMLHGCRAVTSSAVNFTWVDEAFLLEKEVGPWMELPLWIPDAENSAMATMTIDRALSVGLTFRPLAETARDTLQWHKEHRPTDYVMGTKPGRAGLNPDKEAAVLRAWHERK